MAKLDTFYRARQLDPEFEKVDPEDIQDLVKLLQIVPLKELTHPKVLQLNPNFKESSGLVGGADTDLISGDLLVDFKTTKSNTFEGRSLDQLLGYFFLARRQCQTDSSFPKIRRVGFYFSRHGYVWSQDVSIWVSHPEFIEIEKWFFQRAQKEFGKPKSIRR